MNANRSNGKTKDRWGNFLTTPVGFHSTRWMLLVALALLTYALYPVAQGLEVSIPEVGEVAREEVVAPFDLTIYKSIAEREREGEELAQTVLPIFEVNVGVVDSLLERVDTLFARMSAANDVESLLETAQGFGLLITEDEGGYLFGRSVLDRVRRATRNRVQRDLSAGVALGEDLDRVSNLEVLVRYESRERRVPKDSIRTRTGYFAERVVGHPEPNSAVGDQLYLRLLTHFFRPTLLPNTQEWETYRASARQTAMADSVKDFVRANERIINNHEIVTERVRERLVALQQELLNRGGANEGRLRGAFGQILTNGIVLAVFWLLLMLYLPEVYEDQRHMWVFTTVFGGVILASAVIHKFVHPGPELIPLPFAALIITVLFNGRIATVAAMVLAVLLGSQVVYGGHDAFYLALLGGAAAALSVRRIRQRSQILYSVAVVTIAYALAAFTVGIRGGWTLADVGLSVFRGMSNATLSAAMVSLALPIFERMSRITTDLTLLELSNPAHPLLRRLATEIPGTYAHSVAMANLCENACNEIGANGLLARVGCYYHDIGKLTKPLHFVENQGASGNPHDRLPPDVSASIIRGHVPEGVALAEEHKIPDAIKDFIPEHHGTAEISFFLDKARQSGPVSDESLSVFRYPGPKPKSQETAVTMLADGVEAALRVLEDTSVETLRSAVNKLVGQRVESGQLDEAPLTLAQIETVKEVFVRTVSGMQHQRLDYPEESGGLSANWNGKSDD